MITDKTTTTEAASPPAHSQLQLNSSAVRSCTHLVKRNRVHHELSGFDARVAVLLEYDGVTELVQ